MKTETRMFVVARKITRRMFDLGVVVPAWSAGNQVHTDVSGGVPAAWMPAVHAGMTETAR